jgi:hypothetical protein
MRATRLIGTVYRLGLPSEPIRGFRQDLPLEFQLLHLAAKSAELIALLGRRLRPTIRVDLRLRHPSS